jgi:YidC/Oxa1 family membrane protein insertase
MNRDNIIGLILIFVILIGYGILNTPSEEERERLQHQRDSISNARQAEQDRIRQADSIAIPAETKPIVAPEGVASINELDSAQTAAIRDKMGYFAGAVLGEEEDIIIKSELLTLTIAKKGGRLKSVELNEYKTWTKEPLILFEGDDNIFNVQFYSANRLISTQELYFTPLINASQSENEDTYSISGNDSLVLTMRLFPDNHTEQNPKFVDFVYTVKGNDYMVGFTINTEGMQDVIAANNTILNLNWQIDLPRQEKSRKNEALVTTAHYMFVNKEVDKLSDSKDETENLGTGVKWLAFKQQFFSSVLIAESSFNSAVLSTKAYDETNEELLKRMSASVDIPYNSRENNKVMMDFYFGPNHFTTLKAYDLNLESLIPLGWAIFGWINRFLVIPVFNFLDSFGWNYGIIILVLTLLLKTVLFPIAYKTYLSSARMRVLKPDIEELGKKFPKKEDAMKKQQATMALYKKAGVNPMAGCVPMLLQFPILIAMFRFFPASIELRQQGFLWADDLSTYDSILSLPFTIPWYGDHVSLFTLLMTISTIIYTRMNSEMMNTGTQMPGMKTMLYMMPIMLLFVFNSYSSGLSYYYFLANVITFMQMYAFRFMIDEDKIRMKIEENKKKPVKKSTWQKKLEEMAKKQEQIKKRN